MILLFLKRRPGATGQLVSTGRQLRSDKTITKERLRRLADSVDELLRKKEKKR